MSDKDIISIDYFEDNERFADLINGYLFEGREIIRSEDFRESDSKVSRIQKMTDGSNAQAVVRDVVKYLQVHLKIMMIILQNQSDIHYAMPVRIMNEEAAGYHKQWRRIAREHKRKRDLKGAEYLSGFSSKDRLMPLATIVVYFGQKPWDGPRNLSSMLNMDGIPKNLRNIIADYPIHVLEVRRFQNIERFRTDLQVVFGFLQNTENRENLTAYVQANQKQFENLEQDAFQLIRVMSHSPELNNIKSTCMTDSGGVNMCKAIQDMIHEGERRGEKRGERRGIRRGEKRGQRLGLEKGIKLTKRIYHLQSLGFDDAAIAEECRISEKEVAQILDFSVT